jgi:hypothetical protein
MSKIQITDLPATGTELFQGAESFLTELQSVEASAVYGGKKGGSSSKNSGGKMGRSGKSSRGNSSGAVGGGVFCPPDHNGGIIITPGNG